MKNIYLLLLGLIISMTSVAQIPNALNLSTIALDDDNEPPINRSIGLQISIRDGASDGIELFTETHITTTNERGIFSIAIGSGTPTFEALETVIWDNNPKFYAIGIDITGGTNYVELGTPQILPVPYAFTANTALDNNDKDPSNELQSLGDVLQMSNDGNALQIKNVSDPTDEQDVATKNKKS